MRGVLMWCGGIVTVAACATGQPPQQVSSNEPLFPWVSTDQFVGVIVPDFGSVPSESWTPTSADALGAEPIIHECVRVRAPYVAKHWGRYARQYIGVVRAGKRVMRIGFFDTKYHPVDGLRRGLVIVDDA